VVRKVPPHAAARGGLSVKEEPRELPDTEKEPAVGIAHARLAQWIENRVTAFEQLGLAWYAVRLTGSEAIIGNCGMLVGRRTSDEPEIGYEIAHTEREQGYASEAARAVVDECTVAGINRVWATVRPSNSTSLRILESLGFSRAFSEVDERGTLLHLAKELGPRTPTAS